jgi:D-alanyl-D-alanine carboxypeptidase
VRIKGGTIDGVKAVAGYVHDKDGRLNSFAMMANNLIPQDESLWRMHEDMIKELLDVKQSLQ